MFVTTHTVIASTIAVKTGNPYIYLPLAFVNHFILDLLPHFGEGPLKKEGNLRIAIILDAIFGVGFFLFFVLETDFSILMLLLVDILAGWPDLTYIYHKYIDKKRFKKMADFHRKIQKYESPYGIIVEVAIIATCTYSVFFN